MQGALALFVHFQKEKERERKMINVAPIPSILTRAMESGRIGIKLDSGQLIYGNLVATGPTGVVTGPRIASEHQE